MTAAASVPRETSLVAGMARLADIDVDANIRIDPGDLEGLATSIRELGVLEPVKVAVNGERLSLVWGQRRVLAARMAGLELIPVIYGGDPKASTRRSIEQLTENLQRKDLNPIEEAVALRAVLDGDPALTQETLGEQLGRSRSWVANTLRLLGLADEVQAAVRTDEISASHAKAMAVLPEKQQRELVTRITRDKVSAHDLEREIKWKADQAAADEAKVKRTERVAPKVVSALEKAEVPKDAKLYLTSPYDVDRAPVVKAVKAAGWKKVVDQYLFGAKPDGCDCTAFRIEVNGRGAGVIPACDNDDHRASNQKLERANRDAAQAEEARKYAAFVEPFVDALGEIELPVLRVFTFMLKRTRGSYSAWDDVAKLSGPELLESIKKLMAEPWSLHGVDVDALLAELGGEVPA